MTASTGRKRAKGKGVEVAVEAVHLEAEPYLHTYGIKLTDENAPIVEVKAHGLEFDGDARLLFFATTDHGPEYVAVFNKDRWMWASKIYDDKRS